MAHGVVVTRVDNLLAAHRLVDAGRLGHLKIVGYGVTGQFALGLGVSLDAVFTRSSEPEGNRVLCPFRVAVGKQRAHIDGAGLRRGDFNAVCMAVVL